MTQSTKWRALPQTGAETAERDLVGVLCGVTSVLLFSSFVLVSRLGFSAALRPPDIAALRFGVGGLLMAPVLLRYGLAGVSLRDAAALALSGGLGFALLAYTGFSLAPAAHGAVLLHGTLPLTTFAILSVTARERASGRRSAGLALIAAGVLLMACDSLTGASPRQLLGDGFLVAASFSWSAYGVWTRRLGLPPAQGAAIVAVGSMCAFLPVYALLPGKALMLVGARELLLQALVQGVLIGAVSIFVYTRAVTSLGPSTTALLTAAVPCMTSLAAVPLLSERPSLAGMAGVGVVSLGMIVSMPAWAPRPAPALDQPERLEAGYAVAADDEMVVDGDA